MEEEEEDSTSVKEEDMFRGIKGEPLSTHHLHAITNFRRRQPKGFIDVWWLYDDGGKKFSDTIFIYMRNVR